MWCKVFFVLITASGGHGCYLPVWYTRGDVEPEGVRLLAEGPVVSARMNGVDVWLVLGYRVARQVLPDSRFSRAQAVRPDGSVLNPGAANPEFLISMDRLCIPGSVI